MPDQPQYPLTFNCYNCGAESTYPNYLKEDEDPKSVKMVIKRCINCGAENEVEIPDGYGTNRDSGVVRGLKGLKPQ